MKAPEFWSNPPDRPGWLSSVLWPAAALWQLGAKWRIDRARPEQAPVPVLCVGNLTAGGAGKSPMVAALVQHLAVRGTVAHIVSRGYGGRIKGPHLVDDDADSAADVGDEPLMLAGYGTVWVADDRAAGARAAAEAGAKLVILDDGFQNPGLAKDASIVMVDAGQGFGNGRVIPAGPLREPVHQGLDRADLIVLVGDQKSRERVAQIWPVLGTKPVLGARLVPQKTGLALDVAKVIAFAGIGRPEKFFQTLRDLGADIVASHGFADHQVYDRKILQRLVREARDANAILVTTEKDAVRLPEAFRSQAFTVQIRLEPDDWAPIDVILDRICPAPGAEIGTESP
ncbi:MAG: tetraacyldisaccharide 4'-kinase [Pseudomonadota bacterium]